MSISFNDIYTKAIKLFDDPKITVAYETNKIQFCKIMYSYLQNAIAMFTNPVSIGMKIANYTEPQGTMEVFQGDGIKKRFKLDDNFELKSNCCYNYIAGGNMVKGVLYAEEREVEFPEVLSTGEEYAFEQYYMGEFTDNLFDFNRNAPHGNNLIIGEIKDVLARLLVKAWAEEERNLLLDIRNIMQDSDFKINHNDKVLNSKNSWVDQLDSEILQLQNKLAWNIRFMSGSTYIGRG